MPSLSVIAPCYNEEDNVDHLVRRVLAVFADSDLDGEIILVNDGSSDGTAEKIERAEQAHRDIVRGVHHETNRGICEGWNTGAVNARGRYVMTIDADMQYRPEDIAVLYRAIVEGEYDLVQGWRETYKEESMMRRILSRGLSLMLNCVFLFWVKDIKSGFVVCEKSVYEALMADRNDFRLYQHFFIIKALANRYTFKQIPVVFDQRVQGESFITRPLRFSSQVMLDLPKALWRYGIVERFQPARES